MWVLDEENFTVRIFFMGDDDDCLFLFISICEEMINTGLQPPTKNTYRESFLPRCPKQELKLVELALPLR